MRNSVVVLLLLLFIPTSPVTAQEPVVEVSLLGSIGWLEPTATLASLSPEFAYASRRGHLKAGPTSGVGLLVRLPAPIPQLRFTAQRLFGSELIVEGAGESQSLGSASATAFRLEGLIAPAQIGPVAPHAALGLGYMRYDFAAIQDDEWAPLLKERTSPFVSVGLGGTVQLGRFSVVIDAADLISTYDSPPVPSERRPGEVLDQDEGQHDLQLTIGLSLPLWQR